MNYAGRSYWDATVELSESAKQLHRPADMVSPYTQNPLDLTLFVSCYNEEAFIADTLTAVVTAMKMVGKSYEIIVIDDTSKDLSAEKVRAFMAAHPELNIVLKINKKNKGLAQNYCDAAFLGKGTYYRLICGDNPEPIQTLIDVLSQTGQADIIVPYQVQQGKDFYRKVLSKTFTFIVNLIAGNRIRYYNGLQVHLRHNVMRWQTQTRGFGFQAELLCRLINLGFTYKQVPVVTIEKRGGRGNAVTWKNMLSAAHSILKIFLWRLGEYVYRP